MDQIPSMQRPMVRAFHLMSPSEKNSLGADSHVGKVKERNEAYYEKYPEDVERVKTIMQYLTENKVVLPSGLLTPSRFQQLGILFGFHGKVPRRTHEHGFKANVI